ncbi:Lmo1 protein [Saccharomycopsis crataegensis]|uniref:Lmo1 protein n=1 Tax=Saccharomycopsis crataegensis TaxID=43959 RepID=A0AAV5QX89_9ASCO|nr:Lmo1 protein [Saccharomycopsis crataegensis]
MSLKENPESLDSVRISHLIDKFKSAHPEEPLPLSDALQYLNYCISNVVNKFDRQEKVNSVCVIANLSGRLPKSNQVAELFDETFFNELIKIGIQKPNSRLGNEMLKIINSFLRGTFVEATSENVGVKIANDLFMALQTNISILDVVCKRLDESDQIGKYLCYEFVAYLFYGLQNYGFEFFSVFLDITRKIALIDVCENVFRENESNPKLFKDYCTFTEACQVGLSAMNVISQNIKFDPQNPHHEKLVEKVLRYTKKYSLGSIEKDEEIFEKSGITRDPINFISQNFSVSAIHNAKIFLSRNNEVFRKKYYEQLILATPQNCFPVLKMCFALSDFITKDLFFSFSENPVHEEISKRNFSKLQYYFPCFDTVFATCMMLSLDFWSNSRAENHSNEEGLNDDDVMVMINLLKAVLKDANGRVCASKNETDLPICTTELLELLRTYSFQRARDLQYKQVFSSREKCWGVDIGSFDNRLELEVGNFVREERTLQLISGSWFHFEDPRISEPKFPHQSNLPGASATGGGPTSIASTRQKRSKKAYVCLAPNRQHILYKEFSSKVNLDEPQVLEKSDSKHIQISAIRDIKVTALNNAAAGSLTSSLSDGLGKSSSNASRFTSLFINIKSRNVFHRLTLFDRSGKEIVSFYTDTAELASVWADGLKLLLQKSVDSVSEFTKEQIGKLFDVRRTVQFMGIVDEESLKWNSIELMTSRPRVVISAKRSTDKTNEKVAVSEETDEDLYDYNQLIDASDGFFYNG